MTEATKTVQVVMLSPARAVADARTGEHPPPAGAASMLLGSRLVYYVPVSFVAKDWKVSPRRIRALLAGCRLEGIRRENGYWEVAYPYRFTFGQRGPALKRQQKPERRTE